MSFEDELIRRFRGIPRRYQSEPRQRAKPIDHFLDNITKKYKIDTPRIEIQIIKHWKEIVGSQKATRCKPSKIVKGSTLIITTTNTTLRMELQFERSKILKNIQNVCENNTIRDIVVR